MTDPAFQPAIDTIQRLRSRDIGCLELLDHLLARVGDVDGPIRSIALIDAERARARAQAADAARSRGDEIGPLHGLPMTVKEAFDVGGLPTTWGVPAHSTNVATTHALAVRKLIDAGAIVFGKSNVAYRLGDWQTFNPLFGTTSNPHDLTRVPGGSSGGAAAALAAGLTPLEIGSDIGGSIRNPAHFCGIFGHKPSFGVVPQDGHGLPGYRAPADLNVIGPMARSGADLELAFSILAGPSAFDAPGWRLDLPEARGDRLQDFRVAVMLDDPCCAVDTTITTPLQALADKLAGCGVRVSERARPDLDTSHVFALFWRLLRGVTTSALPDSEYAPLREAAAALAPDDLSSSATAARASVQTHREWFAANEERQALRHRFGAFFEDWDILLCPAAASPAFPHDQERPRPLRTIVVNGHHQDYSSQLFWAGFTGAVYLPSTVIPLARTEEGLPVGVQIVGPYLGDRTTLAFARLLEAEIGGFVPPAPLTSRARG